MLIKIHDHRAGGPVHTTDEFGRQVPILEPPDILVAQEITPHRRHGQGVQSETVKVVGDVDRCAARENPLGQAVPERFPKANDRVT